MPSAEIHAHFWPPHTPHWGHDFRQHNPTYHAKSLVKKVPQGPADVGDPTACFGGQPASHWTQGRPLDQHDRIGAHRLIKLANLQTGHYIVADHIHRCVYVPCNCIPARATLLLGVASSRPGKSHRAFPVHVPFSGRCPVQSSLFETPVADPVGAVGQDGEAGAWLPGDQCEQAPIASRRRGRHRCRVQRCMDQGQPRWMQLVARRVFVSVEMCWRWCGGIEACYLWVVSNGGDRQPALQWRDAVQHARHAVDVHRSRRVTWCKNGQCRGLQPRCCHGVHASANQPQQQVHGCASNVPTGGAIAGTLHSNSERSIEANGAISDIFSLIFSERIRQSCSPQLFRKRRCCSFRALADVCQLAGQGCVLQITDHQQHGLQGMYSHKRSYSSALLWPDPLNRKPLWCACS